MITTNKKSFIRIKPSFVVLGLNFLLLILLTNTPAHTEEVEKQLPPPATHRSEQDSNSSTMQKKSVEKIKLVSFNLTSGQRISGKLVNEDPFAIEIAEIKGGKIP